MNILCKTITKCDSFPDRAQRHKSLCFSNILFIAQLGELSFRKKSHTSRTKKIALSRAFSERLLFLYEPVPSSIQVYTKTLSDS